LIYRDGLRIHGRRCNSPLLPLSPVLSIGTQRVLFEVMFVLRARSFLRCLLWGCIGLSICRRYCTSWEKEKVHCQVVQQ